MKITKLGHSCLLVEMPEPVNRTVLFDPGAWSSIDVGSLKYLDDIIITHEHSDHMDIEKIKELQQKFPDARIKAASSATGILNDAGLKTTQDAVEGVEVFDAPHEPYEPFGPTPENMGVHYLDKLTHPGDCVQFVNTKAILALPVGAPWGATTEAVNLAIKLKPKYVIPVHDGQWSDDARQFMYDFMSQLLQKAGATLLQVKSGEPINVDV